jgi:hypothetical protein
MLPDISRRRPDPRPHRPARITSLTAAARSVQGHDVWALLGGLALANGHGYAQSGL